MKAGRVLLGGTGIGLLAALGLWWLAARMRHAEEGALAALGAQHRALASQSQREERRAERAERKSEELDRALAAWRAAKSAKAATTTPAQPPPQTSDLLAADPKLQVLELRRRNAAMHLEFDEFFATERLPPELIAKFAANYLKRAERAMDLTGAAQTQDAAGRQTIAVLERKARDDYEAAQAELLGPERYRRLQEYNRLVPMRNVVVRGFAGAAALEGIPVTAQQADQLLQAAIGAAAGDAGTPAGDLVATVDWAALEAQARRILTPEQYALFSTTAPQGGFGSRWYAKLVAEVQRAHAADAAAKAAGK